MSTLRQSAAPLTVAAAAVLAGSAAARTRHRSPALEAFAGRSAVVTGGSSGIGLAIARRLAEHGAVVTLADVDVDRAQAHARTLREQGARASAAWLDVTDRSAVDDLLRRVADEHGQLDLVVNNAGVGGTLPFEQATAAHRPASSPSPTATPQRRCRSG